MKVVLSLLVWSVAGFTYPLMEARFLAGQQSLPTRDFNDVVQGTLYGLLVTSWVFFSLWLWMTCCTCVLRRTPRCCCCGLWTLLCGRYDQKED